jgi:hypothetical protein
MPPPTSHQGQDAGDRAAARQQYAGRGCVHNVQLNPTTTVPMT